MDAQIHLSDIRISLLTSPVVDTITILEARDSRHQGYFRARLTLTNNDFLEVAEYFVIEDDLVQVIRYRYQWMDETRQTLKKRWDNAKHLPNLPDFPHHVHVGSEDQIVPGKPLSIIELIDAIEQELN